MNIPRFRQHIPSSHFIPSLSRQRFYAILSFEQVFLHVFASTRSSTCSPNNFLVIRRARDCPLSIPNCLSETPRGTDFDLAFGRTRNQYSASSV
jgi:hypothetical protein